MTLPLFRIFVLLGQVNQLFASFFVSLAPVVVYLKLLMVLVYLFAVVSACPLPTQCIPSNGLSELSFPHDSIWYLLGRSSDV